MKPELNEIYRARRRIAGRAYRTPLARSDWLSSLAGSDIYLKLECWQRTRSFKVRGAFNAVAALPAPERARGLVAASAGNHGQGVALAGRELGARATIFVPDSAPVTKKAHIKAFGAELREVPGIYDDAEAAARAFAEETGASFVHAFADPLVIAGQGTIGIEIAEDLAEVREVLVPVGGGGLITGIGTVLRALGGGSIRVVGVQSDQTRAMYAAFEAGGEVQVEQGPTLADGLAGGSMDTESYERARAVTDEMVLVDEASIAAAIHDLFQHDGVVAEGAGAVAVAALAGGVVQVRGPAVLVISGGNIDGARLARILQEG
jgi:threonine dehydratase